MTIKKMTSHNFSFKHSLRAALLTALLFSTSLPAFAQPDPNEQPIGDNPAPQAPGQEWQRMTPEQRYAMQLQFIEGMLRNVLKAMNFTDIALQDAVVASVIEQETLLDEVRAKHRAITAALMGKAPEEQISALMTDLQATVEAAKTKRLASVAALDEKIHFSEQPRLAAVLSLSGVTGDESAYIGGVMASFSSAMTNMGAVPPAPNADAPDEE